MTIVQFLASRYSPARMASRLDIAGSTWSRIRATGRVPTPGIVSRINAAYSDIQTNRLSCAGFSPSAIKKLKAKGPEAVQSQIDIMENLVNTIAAKMKEPDPAKVRASMRAAKSSWDTIEERFAEGWY